ncbi:MAG: hypothetical protein ACN4GG_01450 [Akkermansiaceae bacterium]
MPIFELLLLTQLIASAAMTGVVWIVQLAIYPLFAKIGAEEFQDFHERYMFRVSFVIMPLMAIEALTCAMCFFMGDQLALFTPSLLFGIICASTAFIQIPQHNALTIERVPALVKGNWIRTIAWTTRTLLLAYLVF